TGTTMVLSPNSDFFRFFRNPAGADTPAAPAAPAAPGPAAGPRAPAAPTAQPGTGQ
ncbi:MAG: protease modulator HflC, partial [Mesorhizobium sp.]